MLLTSEEVASRLGRDGRTVRKMCERGSIRAIKLGGVWLIDGDSVAECLNVRGGATCSDTKTR